MFQLFSVPSFQAAELGAPQEADRIPSLGGDVAAVLRQQRPRGGLLPVQQPALSLARQTQVPEETVHRWKHLARINLGLANGVNSMENAPPQLSRSLGRP